MGKKASNPPAPSSGGIREINGGVNLETTFKKPPPPPPPPPPPKK